MKKFVMNCYKWIKMLCGKDVLHVEQTLGKKFVPDKLEGYFNNLTDKVLKCETVDESNLPCNYTNTGEKCRLIVAVLQYGLGSYDLYLTTSDKKYYSKFMASVKYIAEKQNDDGSFNVYEGMKNMPEEKSAMIQGQAASLFLRAYKQNGECKYFMQAKAAIDCMLRSVKEGGTTVYNGDNTFYFQELFDNGQDAILNGWIFAFFGLYDFCLVSDNEQYQKVKEESLEYLANSISKYDRKYWSNYNQENTIASPFYHKLHVAQLEALSMISKRKEFLYYKMKWDKQYMNKITYLRAFVVKAFQKLKNPNDSKLVIVK
ncbi:MAG: hypothetical protein KHY31_04200 [Clostridiales bacterium]|nr:hypothetical protein [Clostridiales bacterium]